MGREGNLYYKDGLILKRKLESVCEAGMKIQNETIQRGVLDNAQHQRALNAEEEFHETIL